MSSWASFWKPEACNQTVLPDMSILIGQKLVESAKIQNFKWDIFGRFLNNVRTSFGNETFYEIFIHYEKIQTLNE